eukprot:CAMPEP_0177251066 /NCGR_PEP_ID=MMETSP0367-20130122/53751_1 /TAXON_ID=447022 ORGANISM="Scrippsiella hangoei-like, Strain SHHI-4" /NCGR_SAMPLE_ID=MMETSP0367 /ASSEMBLY_ACC=CAM_ASM_000362 /LENGTH=217 /DNA_ID=CAMNT_0018703941 /DNA_START=31 /DNA_END=681 /DNA_ORIENTATION=-
MEPLPINLQDSAPEARQHQPGPSPPHRAPPNFPPLDELPAQRAPTARVQQLRGGVGTVQGCQGLHELREVPLAASAVIRVVQRGPQVANAARQLLELCAQLRRGAPQGHGGLLEAQRGRLRFALPLTERAAPAAAGKGARPQARAEALDATWSRASRKPPYPRRQPRPNARGPRRRGGGSRGRRPHEGQEASAALALRGRAPSANHEKRRRQHGAFA